MEERTRRQFLTGAAAFGTAAAAAACSSKKSATSTSRQASSTTTRQAGTTTTAPSRLPDPKDAPFDTVVVLMMENRSFDHMLGWLPGADGKQAGLRYADQNGAMHGTYPLAPDYQGCALADPKHDWQSVATQFAGGEVDGWLQTQPVGDTFPIGYYTEADLPVTAALARNYTTFDRYFCSMLGPTWPNRMFLHCGTTDLDGTGIFPFGVLPRPSKIDLAIWDRLAAADLTGAYYSFGEPMTGLFASKKYDAISYSYDQFLADAKAGKLANVTFVEPNYTTIPELTGTSNDDHPHGSVQVGEGFVQDVYRALVASPQWDRMVFVLNFDEHGGFYDHVVPPRVIDDTVSPNATHPDYTRLGFRVPCIAMGPFAPARLEHAGPYEHCSILRMIEWRWNLEPMRARDRNARNLALALDFSKRRDAFDLPKFDAPAAQACGVR